MMEAVYPTLASSLGLFYGSGGGAAPRTGNRHTGLSLCPYNVYPTADGHIAIITNNETHWRQLAQALNCPQWLETPGWATVRSRCDDMDAVDAAVAAVTRAQTKDRLFEVLIRHRVPCAPVRTLQEVVHDPHLHARGALHWVDHPEYGRLVLPRSALRFPEQEPVPYKPSAALGADTEQILISRLGLSAGEVEALRALHAL